MAGSTRYELPVSKPSAGSEACSSLKAKEQESAGKEPANTPEPDKKDKDFTKFLREVNSGFFITICLLKIDFSI